MSKKLYSVGVVISSNAKKVRKGTIKITKGNKPLGCHIPVVDPKTGKQLYVLIYEKRLMAESIEDALRKYCLS